MPAVVGETVYRSFVLLLQESSTCSSELVDREYLTC